MKLARAMGTVAGLTGLSRIFGFTRDILTAAILGAGPIADAFFIALKLPNFFRRVTAEGAFSVAFVPLYSKQIEADGRDKADAMASNTFFIMSTALTVFVLFAMMVMPLIIYVIAPGFHSGEARYDMAITMSRITFPYLLFMSLTALLGGVLNALDRFAPFAFAPVLFNICLILALIASDLFENAGYAMAWGIFIAGIAQFSFLMTCAWRSGFRVKLQMPKFDADVKQILKLMGPGVIGAGVVHINLFADIIIASFLPTGSIAHLYYADRLNQLPLGIVGIAVGTALLPMLSRAMAKTDKAEARELFNRALEMCLLLSLPAALALMVIPQSIIVTLFERGAFTVNDTLVTARVLTCYAVGLPAYICIKVFATAHWSNEDTVTPVKISIIATVTNIILSIILIQFIGAAGIALGTGLTAWMQFIMYKRALKDHPAAAFDDRLKRNAFKIVIATGVMVFGLLTVSSMTGNIFDASTFNKIISLGTIIASGIFIYGYSILFLRVLKPSDIKQFLKRKK